MKQDQPKHYLDTVNSAIEEKTITIQPGAAKAVSAGLYDATDDAPAIDLTFTPDIHEDIGIAQERLDIPGQSRYMLVYQFQNFSENSCAVTLHYRSQAV